MDDISRRSVFQIIGSVPAVAALAGSAVAQEAHNHAGSPPAVSVAAAHGPYQRKVFDDRQWRTVHVLCDLIIPADETSGGATQAGVPEFIDDWLEFRGREDGNQNLTAQILGGLQWLDNESNRFFQTDFAGASPDQQKQILDRIAWPARAAKADRPWAAFFSKFRDMTAGGFFSSKVGVADLHYLGNRPVAEWKGCDPKIWAIIEERMKNGYKGLGGEVKPLLS
jgi:gluconate 2-dehydrogenase gamma chain